MIIFLFVTISVTYAIYLLRSNFRFISLLFLTVFSISFLLPIIMDKPFNYKLYLDASNYDYTNKLYLLALIVFVVTNLIIQLANIKFEMNNLLIIKTKNIDNIYPIYVLATIVVIMLTGLNIVTGGSTATLENSSIMKMLQGSVLLGYLYLSYLYL
ncbi:oligosaccharide repeat unit polymerase, partial [Staphylococcus arlettae]